MLSILWILLLQLAFVRPDRTPNCRLETPQHLVCTKHLPFLKYPKSVKILELRDLEENDVDLELFLETYPETANVSIFDGTLKSLTAPTSDNKIKVLQLVRVGVENISNNFLRNFPNLQTLNLEGNYLTTMENFTKPPNLQNMYIEGNRFNCSRNLTWVLEFQSGGYVRDLEEVTCWGSPYPDKNITAVAHFLEELRQQCPSYCDCALTKIFHKKMESELLEPIIEVNCSYRGLTEVPTDLPLKTRIIRLEGNEIENLRPVKTNPIFKKVFDLYLDNNRISSIHEMEGSFFLQHFRVFSLSGNRLTEVPTYALDNAFEQNKHMPNALRLYLGGNPWRCDCVFTPVFQEMLQKFAPQIPDLDKIKCSYVEGDENSLVPIIELSRSSVCRSQDYTVQALDFLNGVLATLIILILGKLVYDYYYFKKTGRLPWIVTKMP